MVFIHRLLQACLAAWVRYGLLLLLLSISPYRVSQEGRAYCVTQSQRDPIRIKQGQTLLNFKSKKKPTPGETEPAGHLDSGQAPHSVGQPGGASYRVNSS